MLSFSHQSVLGLYEICQATYTGALALCDNDQIAVVYAEMFYWRSLQYSSRSYFVSY